MSCSGFGPGTTATSSQPSSPQLSRICLVACTSSGTVAYSHLAIARTLVHPPGRLSVSAGPVRRRWRVAWLAAAAVMHGAEIAFLLRRQLGDIRHVRNVQGVVGRADRGGAGGLLDSLTGRVGQRVCVRLSLALQRLDLLVADVRGRADSLSAASPC